MTILNEIQQNYNRLPNKEKQIAKYILEKSDELKNINIKELAEETGTSISTITRFCRHVRCDSFVDLKMRVNTAYLQWFRRLVTMIFLKKFIRFIIK